MKFKIMIIFRTILLLIILFAKNSPAMVSSESTKNTTHFKNEYISMYFPASIYKNIIYEKDSTSNHMISPEDKERLQHRVFSLVRRKPLEDHKEDFGSSCLGSIIECTANGGGSQNYSIDQTSGQIILGDPTAKILTKYRKNKTIYETFHLCGWSSSGISSNYGGECYAVLLSMESKTISLQILLGKNRGCLDFERCWARQLIPLRRMVDSIE